MKSSLITSNEITLGRLRASLILISILFFTFQLSAQSPKTGRAKINYTVYPSTPLPDGVHNFYVDIKNNTDYENITRKTDRSRIKILGSDKFNYVEDSTKADLRFDVTLIEARYDTSYSTIVSKKYTTETEYEETTRWRSILRVMMKTSLSLKEVKDQNILMSSIKEDTISVNSKSFATMAQAKQAFEKKDITSVLSKNLYKLFTRAKRPFLNEVNDKFGYPRKTATFQIIEGTETTHDYSDLADAYEQFKGAAADQSRGRPVDEWYVRAENSIKIWEKAISEYNTNSSKARINDTNINYLYTAMAAGKFLFRKYDEAKAYMDKISEDYKNKSSIKKLYNAVRLQNERVGSRLTFAQGKALATSDIEKLNYLVLYQLYMNYELVEKHQNLQVLPNYFPSFANREMRQINLEGKSAGQQEKIEFAYDTEKALRKLSYSVNRGSGPVVYNYDLVYSKGHLDGIEIGGKRKVSFEYNNDGLINSIKRLKNGAEFEYVFSLSFAGDAFNIKLFVTNNGQRRPSPRKYFVKWNEGHQLTEFNFDVYSGGSYVYNEQGDVASITVNTVNASGVEVEWAYEYDTKGNWTSKNFGEQIQWTRTLTY
ncbi:MAG: hypothetical protein AAFN93_11310 [Bacteroidota bacterium]